jgi:hypothetical protein
MRRSGLLDPKWAGVPRHVHNAAGEGSSLVLGSRLTRLTPNHLPLRCILQLSCILIDQLNICARLFTLSPNQCHGTHAASVPSEGSGAFSQLYQRHVVSVE